MKAGGGLARSPGHARAGDAGMVRAVVLIVVGILLFTAPARAVISTEVDTFQGGTTEGWGGGAAPTNVASGGPAGAGDRFLQLTSFNRLATENTAQWAGNYAAAGVMDVSVDFLNPNE